MKHPYAIHKIRVNDPKHLVMECGSHYWMHGAEDWDKTNCGNCLKWKGIQRKLK